MSEGYAPLATDDGDIGAAATSPVVARWRAAGVARADAASDDASASAENALLLHRREDEEQEVPQSYS